MLRISLPIRRRVSRSGSRLEMKSRTDSHSASIVNRGATEAWHFTRRVVQKMRELAFETAFYARLGQTWPERLSVVKLIAKLYAARLMPFDTFGWETTIRVRGSRYCVGVRTSEAFIFHEIYESRQYDRHPDFVPQRGWTVFDVGANIGVFTVLQARKGANVYSFEPNLESYRRLSKNVAMNHLTDRVHLFATALGDEPGTGTMKVSRGGTTGGVVIPATKDGLLQGPSVPIVTLDQVVPTLAASRIDLLKIDAEGSEVAVLRGAERTLRTVQRVIVEYHSRDLLRSVEDILARAGFSQELLVDYYPEDLAAGQEEVGILYLRRLN
jgi:FkbM family methyltransferase